MPRIIFDFNRTLYDPETDELVPDAYSVLQTLSRSGIPLYLISRNEGNREEVLERTDIAQFFKEVSFVERKRLEDFTRVVWAAQGDKVFVVGDLVREDIHFGNRAGATTIWFRNGKFAGEGPTIKKDEPRHIITKLTQVLDFVLTPE